jgi:CubicO group peptidase (beta-lactamase class C family)
MQLLEKGEFLLDEPICEFIPEFKDVTVKDADGNTKKAEKYMTIRHLFTMTAGFNYVTDDNLMNKATELGDGKATTLSFAKALAYRPLDFEPGTKWQYSLCHDVLGAVIEVITGKKLSDYMKENIFDPLGMNNTCFHLPEDKYSQVAEQYSYEVQGEADIVRLQMSNEEQKGAVVKVNKLNKFQAFRGADIDSGGAGIISNPDDYVKLMAALANHGTGVNGERILSPGAVELMKMNQLSEEMLKSFTWPDLQGYGYGLGVRTLMDKVKNGNLGTVGEFGWSGAAGSTTLADTELNLAMAFSQHILNPRESCYCPRLRNVLYSCFDN